jgi:glycosyltransferase involved in cell wall biosynthesis
MGGGTATVRVLTIDVLVATPLGRGGRGGIDRLMDAVRGEMREGRIGDCRVRFATTRGPFGLMLSPFHLAAFLGRMAALRALGKLDLVHVNLSSHGSTQRKLIVCRWARALGIPYVVHLHGSRFRTYFDAARPAKQVAVRTMLGMARRVIVLGQVWQDFVASHVAEAQARIVILPNASPAIERKARTRDAPVRILFLGRLGARKGVPELIGALAQIADLPDWDAVIAGDGEVEETRVHVEAAGLSSRVQVPGWVLRSMAAFSAGRPKASQPMGCSTFLPLAR